MKDGSVHLIPGVPTVPAWIGLCLLILWYLLVKWPGAWGQPLPLLGYMFCGMAAPLLVGLLSTILNAVFRSSLRKIGG